jgi:hypothetical protein
MTRYEIAAVTTILLASVSLMIWCLTWKEPNCWDKYPHNEQLAIEKCEKHNV